MPLGMEYLHVWSVKYKNECSVEGAQGTTRLILTEYDDLPGLERVMKETGAGSFDDILAINHLGKAAHLTDVGDE